MINNWWLREQRNIFLNIYESWADRGVPTLVLKPSGPWEREKEKRNE